MRYLWGAVAVLACGGLWTCLRGDDPPAQSHTALNAPASQSTGPLPPARVTERPLARQDAAVTAAEGKVATDADATMEQIRSSVRDDPQFAEMLAVEHQRQFPDSPDADERDALLVAAIFNQQHIDRARHEARRYYRRHPDGLYTNYLIRETGAHPPPPPRASNK